jgi:hypothetical protein
VAIEGGDSSQERVAIPRPIRTRPTTPTNAAVVSNLLARIHRDSEPTHSARRAPVTGFLVRTEQHGRIYAALDVTDPEPLPPGHPLWSAPNLLLTPHVGGAVHGFPGRAYALVRAQVVRYAAGEPLINVVEGDY